MKRQTIYETTENLVENTGIYYPSGIYVQFNAYDTTRQLLQAGLAQKGWELGTMLLPLVFGDNFDINNATRIATEFDMGRNYGFRDFTAYQLVHNRWNVGLKPSDVSAPTIQRVRGRGLANISGLNYPKKAGFSVILAQVTGDTDKESQTLAHNIRRDLVDIFPRGPISLAIGRVVLVGKN